MKKTSATGNRMSKEGMPRRGFLATSLAIATAGCTMSKSPDAAEPTGSAAEGEWISLFNGTNLDGWRASENTASWQVRDGVLSADGPRSHLFYVGKAAPTPFRNFDFMVDVITEKNANSGIFFHTDFVETGSPPKGYEVQINNSYPMIGDNPEFRRTGGLFAIRDIYKAWLPDDVWFRVRVCVIGKRIRVWVNDIPTVDYVEPEDPPRARNRVLRRVSEGTIALQAHDPGSRMRFRNPRIRLLPDDADPLAEPRASEEGYGLRPGLIDQMAALGVPITDFHVHIRGGMTVDKAVVRQAVTGVNCGVLENVGRGWPIDDNDKLRSFLDGAAGRPVFVGVQVNDRDWADVLAPDLVARLDYVLADTMIMPMPHDDSPPVKLWITDNYTIDDPDAWMERYVRHNLRVLSEPISILANPTWLPPALASQYDRLWTEERMTKIVRAAVDRGVALEINASSGYPPLKFLQLAKEMGAKFSLGTNNFDDKPIDMHRCFEMIEALGLRFADMFLPRPKA